MTSWPIRSGWSSAITIPRPGVMVRIALAPCSPLSVTPQLMRRTAALAERLDVRLHTPGRGRRRGALLRRDLQLPPERAVRARRLGHRACLGRALRTSTRRRLRGWRPGGTGVTHCPNSIRILGAGIAAVRELRAAGVAVGIGCDGSVSADCASLWLETRAALLLARLRGGARGCRRVRRWRWRRSAVPPTWAGNGDPAGPVPVM